MRDRLWFIFRKRYQEVKPVSAVADLFGWQTLEVNALEAFRDDLRRYGLRIGVRNFIETVVWRNQIFTEKYR